MINKIRENWEKYFLLLVGILYIIQIQTNVTVLDIMSNTVELIFGICQILIMVICMIFVLAFIFSLVIALIFSLMFGIWAIMVLKNEIKEDLRI